MSAVLLRKLTIVPQDNITELKRYCKLVALISCIIIESKLQAACT